VESGDEDDDGNAVSRLTRVAMDDTVLDKLKAQYPDLSTTPIANSLRSQMLGELSNSAQPRDGTLF